MGRWGILSRRDLLGRALGTQASFCLLPPGAALADHCKWAEGYGQRCRLVYVDFRTLERTMKDSGKWYAKLAATGDLQ